MYLDNVFTENPYTVEGELLHQNVHEEGVTRRGDLLQIRRVWVFSRRYNLIGIADLLEEKAGELYPVEYKRGRKGDWKNDQLQLCAQALCLEEMLSRSIPFGYIYYAASARRLLVNFSDNLRKATIQTIHKVQQLTASRVRPPPLFSRKCLGCSLYPSCLPRETKKVQEYIISLSRGNPSSQNP
ncbi:MAG: CRISPR-associated protein Cas4 [bacterium JZ-2024 1]